MRRTAVRLIMFLKALAKLTYEQQPQQIQSPPDPG